MKLLKSQADETTLTNFGAKAAQLIKEQKYCELVEKFGYALAHDREKAEAVREDIERCLSKDGSRRELSSFTQPKIVVKFFDPNYANLFVLVECWLPLKGMASNVLVELIVAGNENEKYLTLEDVSYAA